MPLAFKDAFTLFLYEIKKLKDVFLELGGPTIMILICANDYPHS